MGITECTQNSNEQEEKDEQQEDENKIKLNKTVPNFDNDLGFKLNFKDYNDYFKMTVVINEILTKNLPKIIIENNFKCPKRVKKDSEFFYYEYMNDVDQAKLFDISMCVYQKIISIYKSSQNYPKQEIAKISYGLISRYQTFFSGEEDELNLITEKIIKRINYFSEEFPKKLKNLKKIFLSRKIYLFAYDRNLKINIYIEPFNETILKNYEKDEDEKEKANSFLKDTNYYYHKLDCNSTIKSEKNKDCDLINSDYITYIFFIKELIIPFLKEKYNFSSLLNITINFGGKDVNTELIQYIMTSFNYIQL